VDEAHHCVANSYKKLWDMYPKAKKLGVTATPWRMNNGGFGSVFDKIIISQSIQSFIDAGWLAPYDYYSISYNSEIQKEIESITEFDVEGDYKISALEKKIDTSRIRAQLLDSYLKFAKGKKGIIYSVSRKHSDHICQEYREAGINIVRIDSKTPKDERKLYVDRFRKGLIDIIVNVDIFSEGFDCPDIEFIQLARPTKSLVKYLQQVGRGLRPTAGKSICLILDNVGLHFQFGLPNSDRNWEECFIGSPHIPARRNSSGGSILNEHKERNYSEGTDEMQLIVTSSKKDDVTTNQWSDRDIELLRTLFEEKQCPIDILVTIFKRSENEIRNKISELAPKE
jgi:superfamily II DNA or RNA helicase